MMDFMINQTCFSVFPSRITDSFFIKFHGDIRTLPFKVEVHGIQGERIFMKDLIHKRLYQVSMTGKPPGLYLIKLSTQKDVEKVKIIKL